MDLSLLSSFVFFFLTYVYYYKLKLPLGLAPEGKPGYMSGGTSMDSYATYMSSNNSNLLMYLLIVVTSQFGINLYSVIQKCGGTVGKNVLVAFMMTVVPWTLIFGSVLALLVVYPGLKSAFADVVGYFAISGDANEILSTILVDTKINSKINAGGADDGDESAETKQSTAEAIMKLCGNKGILINTMNPENFNDMWSILKPLLKPVYKKTDNDTQTNLFKKKEELFALVVKKDNIGEAFWFIYTGLLLMSIVSYNLTSRACEKDLEKMKQEQADYAKKSAELKAAKDLRQSGPSYVKT
jgi:hypothetical protein